MLSKKQEERTENNIFGEIKFENDSSNASNQPHVYLEPIDANCSAVYQSITSPDTFDTTDMMKAQVREKCQINP